MTVKWIIGSAAIAMMCGAMAISPNDAASAAIEARACVDCAQCGTNGHKAYPGDETSVFSYGHGEHTTCWEGAGLCNTVQSTHQACEPEAPELAEALFSIASSDNLASLNDIIRDGKGLIAFNAKRGAVQIYDCGGAVRYSVPIPAAAAADWLE